MESQSLLLNLKIHHYFVAQLLQVLLSNIQYYFNCCYFIILDQYIHVWVYVNLLYVLLYVKIVLF